MRFPSLLSALAVCMGLAASSTQAATCNTNSPALSPSNPDAAYILTPNGTATDSRTGLMWQRCSEGQTWSGGTCIGTASWVNQAAALSAGPASSFAGYSDWRLPNIKELRSLVEECRTNPSINETVFPATITAFPYWTSSVALNAAVPTPNWSWYVNFFSGGNLYDTRFSKYYVRLVRGGDDFDNLSSATTSLLSVSGSGTGSGTVTSNVGGVNCTSGPGGLSGTCATSLANNSSVTLTATPAGGNTFNGWSGACSGSLTTCSLSMTGAKSVGAAFVLTAVAQPQSIGSISFSPPSLAVGASSTVSATASSGLPVSFSSSTPGICTVSGNNVSGIATGTCTIAANQAGNASYLVAPQVTQNITVKAAQSIGAIGFAPTSLAVGGASTAIANATSGLAVTFGSSTPGTCTVIGSTVSGLSIGSCTIVANQTGNAVYAAAPQVSQSIIVSQGSQSISAITLSPGTLTLGSTSSASATATSGLAVSFTSSTPGICTVSGSSVSGVAAGTCTLVASQAGNANYLAAAPVTQNFPVKATQTIGAISFAPNSLAAGGTTLASATASSGLPVSFSSTTPSICSVSGNTVTGVAVAATCTIAANQAGNGSFAAAPQVTKSIPVNQGSQTIGTISFSPGTLVVGATTTAIAPATSGLVVSFSTSTPATCTVSGSSVTGVGAGRCTIAANQAGNANYFAAPPQVQNITVGPGSQAIGSINFSPNTLAVGGTSTASASASSGLAVSFSSTTATVCSVTGSTVSALTTGICIVAANQGGSANYMPAPQVTQGITVKPGQTISAISFAPVTLTVGGVTTASATASSGLAVSFSSTTPGTCTVSDSSVSGVAAGTCTVAANQAGDTSNAAAPQVTGSITVGPGSQTIGAIGLSTALTVGGTSTASATASSGLAVSFGSSTPSICTVSGSLVTGVSVGTCTLSAGQIGTANYTAAAPVVQDFTVRNNQAIGLISFTPATLIVGGTTSASASATSSLAVSFDSASLSVCTVSGSTVSGVSAGTCTITGNQDGNSSYVAAPAVVQNIDVLASQTIGAISFLPATLSVGGSSTANASATSGLAVTFSSTTPSICSVSGSSVSGVAAGTCTIAANQAGNSAYAAAPQVTGSITVNLRSQTIGTISFSPATLAVGGSSTASATASSGLAVIFSSTTPSICTVSASSVNGVATGTCSIAADQPGNASYAAAPAITQSITVSLSGLSSQSIGPISFLPTTLAVGGTTTASATASSGLAVIFSSATPSICTVSGSSVSGVAAGTCSIAADQPGNASFAAAAQVTQPIPVTAAASSLSNISTRAQAQTGDNVTIGGFVISGSTPKTVLIRARGPSLAALGVPGVLANPTVTLYSGSTALATNDNWGSASNQAAIAATGLAPTNAQESAILTTLSPGAYTAIVSGVAGSTGIGIVEVIEIDRPESQLINISTRGQVQTGDSVMIGGFVISGSTPKTVLIRARGPSLVALGVPGVLANPTVTLYSGSTALATNDNWGSASNQAAIVATGLAPTNAQESAILTTLNPGAYTVIVSGVAGSTGIAIVEVLAQ